MNPLYPSNGLYSITDVSFYKTGFGIKYAGKAFMLSNKETEIQCVINFNGMSTHHGLFYAKRQENNIYCTFTFTFFVKLFLES